MTICIHKKYLKNNFHQKCLGKLQSPNTTKKYGFSKGQLDQSDHIDQKVCPF